jgi:hypothetical protein
MRRLFNTLTSQGLEANRDVTFLTDGGEGTRTMLEFVTPRTERVLDWFHITMRLTVLRRARSQLPDGHTGLQRLCFKLRVAPLKVAAASPGVLCEAWAHPECRSRRPDDGHKLA